MKKIDSFTGKYRWLSNYSGSPITVDEITYPTVEHAFQAMKTSDVTEKRKIAAVNNPALAKQMGRAVKLREDWEEVKNQVMLDILRLKFSDPDLAKLLAATGDAKLAELNSWHDNYWGSCTCRRCGNRGKNVLGHLLMEVRKEAVRSK